MSGRNTFIRSLHDIGVAAWFGGALMGAVGLNGATAEAKSPQERLALSSTGWGKWAPVQVAAIVAHGIGGIGLVVSNKSRLGVQREGRANAVVKTIVTGLAGGATLYAGILGTVISDHRDEGGAGVTEPQSTASDELERAQERQKVVQWAIPALTAVIIILSAQQGEQQRPIKGLLASLKRQGR